LGLILRSERSSRLEGPGRIGALKQTGALRPKPESASLKSDLSKSA
jgi:hypothetical protein